MGSKNKVIPPNPNRMYKHIRTRLMALAISSIFFSLSTVYAQSGSGHCLDFNGSSQYGTAGTFNLELPQFSLMGWVYVDNFKTAFPNITSIMGIEQSGETALLRVGDASIPNNQIQFVMAVGATQNKLNSVTLLQTDRWYHLAATYDGTTMRLYINGVLDASMSQTGLPNANGLFEIARNYGNDRILDGKLDELSVWSTELSQATIRSWMCRKITPTHPDYTDLMAYWPMNDGSGTSLQDQSPNTNNATLISSPSWQFSGAHIGDTSIYSYTAPFNLNLPHPDGDFMELVSTTGSPDGFHLYRVDSVPNITSAQSPLTSLDTTRHWGVFRVGSGNYSVKYDYTLNPVLQGQNDCDVYMGRKNDNAATNWVSANVTSRDIQADTMRISHTASSQFIAGYVPGNTQNLSFTATNAICFGDSTGSLQVTTQGGVPPYAYTWPDGSTGTDLTNIPGGWYAVTVTDANNCASIDSGFISQPSQLTAQASTTQNNTCEEDLSGVITVVPSGGTAPYSFLWNTPDNSTATTIINLPAGTYVVTLTDGNGCTTLDTTTVNFDFPSPVPFLGNDTTVCSNTQLLLTPANGPYAFYLWSDNSSNTSLYISGNGVTSVTVTDANGCSGVDSISYTEVTPKQVDLGGNVSFTGSGVLDAGSGFLAYLWSDGETTPTITVTQTGVYSVEATDSNGCVTIDQVTVTVTPVGVDELNSESSWRAYPNPSNGLVTLEFSAVQASPVELILLDSRGAVLRKETTQPQQNRIQLDLSGYATGIYYLQVGSGAERTMARIQVIH